MSYPNALIIRLFLRGLCSHLIWLLTLVADNWGKYRILSSPLTRRPLGQWESPPAPKFSYAISINVLSVNTCKGPIPNWLLNMQVTRSLTLEGQPNSDPLDSPYMMSYWHLIVTYDLARFLCEICIKLLSALNIFQAHSRSNALDSRYMMISFWHLIVTYIINRLHLNKINLWKSPSDLDFDLSWSLRVKCGGAFGLLIIWFPINV